MRKSQSNIRSLTKQTLILNLEEDFSDTHLLTQIGKGDKSAMTEFVSRHYNRIADFAQKHLGKKTDAEDVAQEVFMRVWQKAPLWEDRELPPLSWLYRIAYHRCIDELRKYKPETQPDMLDCLTSNDLPDKSLQQQQQDEILYRALRSLPQRQYTAIILCNIQGVSNREAALTMDISVEALESLLSRERKNLRLLLVDTAGESS